MGDEVRRAKCIVFVDANNEVVPFPDDFYDPFVFRDYYMWSAEEVQNVEAILGEIKAGVLDDQFETLARNNPSDAEKIMKYKDIVGYDIREPTEDTTEASLDKNMKIVGLNMFNDAIDSLESSISSLTSATTDNLKDDLKFSSIEASTEEEGVYHTVLSSDNAAGQLEFVDTLAEGEAKVIVFLDANNDACPFRLEENDVNTQVIVESIPWSEENVGIAQTVIINITNGSFNALIAQWKEEDPDNADKYERMKSITQYEVHTGPDKKMKIVGQNMFNSRVSALTARIAELEKRLETLISAFQDEPTATEVLDKLKSKTPMTIREVLELDRIISSSAAFQHPTDLSYSIYEAGSYIYTWEKTFDDTDADTTSIINLYDALKESASISEPFQTYYGNRLYKALLKVENKTTDMTTYIQKWEDVNSDVAAKREAFFQKIAEYTTAIENHAAFPLRDRALFNIINNADVVTPQDPEEVIGFYQTIHDNLSNLSLDMNDKETKMMADLYDELKGGLGSFNFELSSHIDDELRNRYYNGGDVEITENAKKYVETRDDIYNDAVLTFTK